VARRCVRRARREARNRCRPLARRSGEDAGPPAVRAGLLGVYLDGRVGQFHEGQRLDGLRSGWGLDRLATATASLGVGSIAAAGGVSSGGVPRGSISLLALPEQPGQPAEHSRLR